MKKNEKKSKTNCDEYACAINIETSFEMNRNEINNKYYYLLIFKKKFLLIVFYWPHWVLLIG
jgi:hypothetical protein